MKFEQIPAKKNTVDAISHRFVATCNRIERWCFLLAFLEIIKIIHGLWNILN